MLPEAVAKRCGWMDYRSEIRRLAPQRSLEECTCRNKSASAVGVRAVIAIQLFAHASSKAGESLLMYDGGWNGGGDLVEEVVERSERSRVSGPMGQSLYRQDGGRGV